ncbi:hypothetical protein BL253_02220 [Pseudofrankia asymbiotica]|uniref:Uncharacterized protein n=1 Tax=Pseudofrankia asymbiotica TaxID=1834516 RepID=A0A1V2IJ43_9ACTN|nr:hypothetical protein BL253_02220 [Pseudofrankia asymbiotica]
MAEASLDDLHVRARRDQEARVEVADLVEVGVAGRPVGHRLVPPRQVVLPGPLLLGRALP